ncbi:1178_t:CDS:1, partial [Ambispora gerdemannii]
TEASEEKQEQAEKGEKEETKNQTEEPTDEGYKSSEESTTEKPQESNKTKTKEKPSNQPTNHNEPVITETPTISPNNNSTPEIPNNPSQKNKIPNQLDQLLAKIKRGEVNVREEIANSLLPIDKKKELYKLLDKLDKEKIVSSESKQPTNYLPQVLILGGMVM